MPSPALLTPFTVIDQVYKKTFEAYLNHIVGSIQAAVVAPLLACVTIWVIVQGVMVMRGDLDARKGLTQLIKVALVVGLVTSSSLYQEYVQDMFHDAIPEMVRKMGGNFGFPTATLTLQLDGIFRAGQFVFQSIASHIPQMDELDSLSFDGAQYLFYFTLWGIFGVYHVTGILTSVLVAIGPLILVGFLFESTVGIATRWVGQLVGYALLLLMTSIVASLVVAIIAATVAAMFATALLVDTLAAQLIGLYELDLFILTGNALVVALPGIAMAIGGGAGEMGSTFGQSIFRQVAKQRGRKTTNPSTISMSYAR